MSKKTSHKLIQASFIEMEVRLSLDLTVMVIYSDFIFLYKTNWSNISPKHVIKNTIYNWLVVEGMVVQMDLS